MNKFDNLDPHQIHPNEKEIKKAKSKIANRKRKKN